MTAFLSVGEVADRLGVPEYRVRYLIRKERFEFTRVGWGIAIPLDQLSIVRKLLAKD